MIGLLRTVLVWIFWFMVTYLLSQLIGSLGDYLEILFLQNIGEGSVPISKLFATIAAIIHFLEKEI